MKNKSGDNVSTKLEHSSYTFWGRVMNTGHCISSTEVCQVVEHCYCLYTMLRVFIWQLLKMGADTGTASGSLVSSKMTLSSSTVTMSELALPPLPTKCCCPDDVTTRSRLSRCKKLRRRDGSKTCSWLWLVLRCGDVDYGPSLTSDQTKFADTSPAMTRICGL